MGAITKYVPPTVPLRSEAAVILVGDAQPALLDLASRIEGVVDRLRGVEKVSDDDHARALNDLLAGAKLALASLEADRVERKRPILEEGRAIDALYSASKDAFERIEKRVKTLLKDHVQKKQEEAALQRAEAERLRLAAAAARDQALEKLAVAEGDGKAQAERAVGAATEALIEANRALPDNLHPNRVRSGFADSTIAYKKKVEVVDIKAVPRELLEEVVMQDWEGRTKQERPPLLASLVLKKKLEDVPGLCIFEDATVRTRIGLQ